MIVNFFCIEKRLNGGSIYFQALDTNGLPFFTAYIERAKRYTSKVDAVRERSDLGIVKGTSVEEHQLEFTSLSKHDS